MKATWLVEYTVSGLNKWLHQNKFSYIPNQLENAGSNTWKLSLIRESNDFPMLG
ncbi:MAG: winged helix-turn-helix domain-containing protein, partial [Thiohalomonas sp.]|nr:winged helix-turn-helix domain-containing protein [Thiohalomonas sp.]